MNEIVQVIRYTAPTKFEPAPFGTQMKVLQENEAPIVYIQLGSEDAPHWERMGILLELIYENKFLDTNFMASCLERFKNLEKKPSSK